MSPKIPRKTSVTTTHQTDANAPTPHRPMFDVSSIEISPRAGIPDLAQHSTNFGTAPADANPRLPAVEIFQLPAHSAYRSEHSTSINDYWLSETFVRGMQPADNDGFRWIVGRKFADVEYQGAVQTTHVGEDETGTLRSKLLTERVPSGPRLYKNADSPTWRLTEQPAPKRPRLAPVTTPINQSRYSPSWRSPDAQGYYEMNPLFGSRKDDMLFAFRDSYGNYIAVDPPAVDSQRRRPTSNSGPIMRYGSYMGYRARTSRAFVSKPRLPARRHSGHAPQPRKTRVPICCATRCAGCTRRWALPSAKPFCNRSICCPGNCRVCSRKWPAI